MVQNAAMILQEYTTESGDVWFVKFDVSIPLGIFAVGNALGKIFIFPLTDIPESLLKAQSTPDEIPERYQFEKSCSHLCVLSHPRYRAQFLPFI